MMVVLNGEFVPEEQAVVSVFDRSFQYGDGIFEAILVHHGQLFRWHAHAGRLGKGAAFMKLALPWSAEKLSQLCLELVKRNSVQSGMIRLQISRGVGPRGYAPAGSEKPILVITTHPHPGEPRPWKLLISSFRVTPGDPLHQHKNTSRLLNVLAASEAKGTGADEALLLDTNGNVTEGTSSSICWVEDSAVVSTPVAAGVLPGTTRAIVAEICRKRGIPSHDRMIHLDELLRADGVFATVTSRGVVEVISIDGRPINRSPVVAELQAEWRCLLDAECPRT